MTHAEALERYAAALEVEAAERARIDAERARRATAAALEFPAIPDLDVPIVADGPSSSSDEEEDG